MDTEMNVLFEGLLEKESEIFKKKSKIWVVLDATGLSFYRPERRSSCIGSIKVVDIQTCSKRKGQAASQFEIQTTDKAFLFNAENVELADTWVEKVETAKTAVPSETNQTVDSRGPTSPKLFNRDSDTIKDLPNLSNSTIFGVKLKSRPVPSSPIRKDSPSLVPHSPTLKSISMPLNAAGTKTETSQKCKDEIELHNSANTKPAPSISSKLLNEVQMSKASKETQKNIGVKELKKIPTQASSESPKVNGVCGNVGQMPLLETERTVTDCRSDKVSEDRPENGVANMDLTESDKMAKTDIQRNIPTSSCDKDNGNVSSTFHGQPDSDSVDNQSVQVRRKTTKSVASDDVVDISGVEMRRSRRSNRNNSVNESWSQSITSTNSKLDTDSPPVITITETTGSSQSSELFDLESILGPLIAKESERQTVGVSVQHACVFVSEARDNLKQYFEGNSGKQFILDDHTIKHDNSVQLLQELLNV